MKNRKILSRSLDWIRNHPNALNLDVPNDLVGKWIFDDDPEETKPNGFYLMVFSFGFFQHSLLNSNLPIGHKHEVASARLFECFDRWQMKLALAEIHRKTDLGVAPLSLFGFPDNEQIRYWPKSSPPHNEDPAPTTPRRPSDIATAG